MASACRSSPNLSNRHSAGGSVCRGPAPDAGRQTVVRAGDCLGQACFRCLTQRPAVRPSATRQRGVALDGPASREPFEDALVRSAAHRDTRQAQRHRRAVDAARFSPVNLRSRRGSAWRRSQLSPTGVLLSAVRNPRRIERLRTPVLRLIATSTEACGWWLADSGVCAPASGVLATQLTGETGREVSPN